MIELNPVPSPQWQERYDALMSDAWLSRKLDRARRWREHEDYIRRYCDAELNGSGVVVDLGCGAGEFLEIARQRGHAVLGVDAPSGDGGMGDAYVSVCRLLHERQRLSVVYERGLNWMTGNSDLSMRCRLLNSRGSVEQMFSEFMEGDPHDLHHDCRRLSWREDDSTRSAIRRLFTGVAAMLMRGGCFLMHANGAGNHSWALAQFKDAASAAGLHIDLEDGDRVRKWVRA